MIIFGMESSCDETSAALVKYTSGNTPEILSDIVATQVETHARYGGVVPEIASRAHLEAVSSVARKAFEEAGLGPKDIDAVAVTCTPGLIGSLLVGLSFAKSFAFSWNKPLVPVNHIKAHAAAVYPSYPDIKPPYYAVIVSGSHTSIYRVKSYTDFEEVGTSRDDAAGEAFDKVGRRLGLKYPCGADMDKLVRESDGKTQIKLPSPHIHGTNDFSFSGLKTAAVNLIHNTRQKYSLDENSPLPEKEKREIATAFTASVCCGISEVVDEIMKTYGDCPLVLAGGVGANSHLRKSLSSIAEKHKVPFATPPLSLCGDNAAMVAVQGCYEFEAGLRADVSLNAYASEEAAMAAEIFRK